MADVFEPVEQTPVLNLPTLAGVEGRLGDLLGGFEAAEMVERQRAEDLVASSMILYGAAFRRCREVLAEHGATDLIERWSTREPLSGLLALHQADSPAPPPIPVDDVRRGAATVEGIIDELLDDPGPVAERSMEMLTVVVDLHEAGLAQLTGAIDPDLRPPRTVLDAMTHDDLIASLLLIHGLHPEPASDRLERVLADLTAKSGVVATVELVALTDEGVHLRVDAANPSDAYRLRLTVERTLDERLPDLVPVLIDGGEEPVQPSSVMIPVESLRVRSSRSESEAGVSPT